MVEDPKSSNITRSEGLIDAEARNLRSGHGSCTVWFTGLSGSGKSTLALALEAELHSRKVGSYVLDGDNIRFGLNRDLGFTAADRTENIRRVGEVARLFCDSGLIVLTAFISPYLRDRELVRSLHTPSTFMEVYLNTPLEECERRDEKGLYRKARNGEIEEFTGISAPYEPPVDPELVVDTRRPLKECVNDVLAMLSSRRTI
ncbi:MAG TPA: adenylyl-sulfate kinase [Acidimicrobiia bacterium]|nr:adenylyl-sulfate kinase [Acidimicrobiia bacterium]HIL06078.1 adenylyl-sulfate kinase [Acidimicrobiia bacterium]